MTASNEKSFYKQMPVVYAKEILFVSGLLSCYAKTSYLYINKVRRGDPDGKGAQT